MKKFSQLFAVGCLAAFAFGLSTLTAKEEKKAIAGSIQISQKTKSADLPALAKISLDAATQAALAAAPGKVKKAKLEVEDGSLIYSFKIVGSDKATTEVAIDAGDGKVLQSAKETEDDDDEKKGEKEDEDDDDKSEKKKDKD